MKKFLLLSIFVAFGFVGCTNNEPAEPVVATSIELNATELNLTVGDVAQLTATITPKDSIETEVSWTIEDSAVATVEAGLVTAVAPGKTTLTATVGSVSATCKITVDEIGVESVELSQTEAELNVGESMELTATVTPEDAADKTVVWASEDDAVATVVDGVVTAVAVGETNITATAGGVTATCAVKVLPVAVEDVEVSQSEASLGIGATLQLTATVTPENATNKNINWSSSDEAVATVDESGLVTGVAEGEATIMAEADGIFGLCTITVIAPAHIGDFYYSDGSYSSTLDTSKSVIGVVFYTGDPTVNDAILRRDHPNCNHGLVLALTETQNVYWQKEARKYNSTVSAWVEANGLEYQTLLSGIEYSDPMNKINGYNNTKAIEAFNAAEENAEWPVTAMNALDDHRRTVAAPETSSGWYFPSIKELNLAFSGDYQGPIVDFENEDTTVMDTINASLRQVPNAIIYDNDYISSTELDEYNVYDMMVFSWYVPTEGVSKTASICFRAVLAF